MREYTPSTSRVPTTAASTGGTQLPCWWQELRTTEEQEIGSALKMYARGAHDVCHMLRAGADRVHVTGEHTPHHILKAVAKYWQSMNLMINGSAETMLPQAHAPDPQLALPSTQAWTVGAIGAMVRMTLCSLRLRWCCCSLRLVAGGHGDKSHPCRP